MKVTEVNVYVVDTGGFRPPIVELKTDEGLTGIGEGAVGFGIGCHAAGAMMSDLAENFVLGQDPGNINTIWNDFYFHTFWGKGGGPIFYAAVSALEQALWDIKGKALGVPVYELFGGKQRDELRVYANDWGDKGFVHPEEMAERAVQVTEDGFDCLKMYPLSKYDPVRNLTRHIKNREVSLEDEKMTKKVVRLVREAIGSNIDLMVDVTAEGPADVMTRIGKSLEEFGLFWYEEPVDAFDVKAYRQLHDKVNIPIAAGERFYTRHGFHDLIESRGVDIVQPDPGTCGGLREIWAIANMAEAYSMRIAPHNCGGPILTSASVQMAACLSNLAILEVFPYRPDMHYDIVENPLEKTIRSGRLAVPTAPGLGVTLNHKTVDPFLISHLEMK